jgi:hypothetical protein
MRNRAPLARRPGPRPPQGGAVALAGLVTALLAAGPVLGMEPADEIQTRDGVRFACTGSGLDAREDPRWGQFAARIEAATQDGRYLGNVTYTVADAAGGTLLRATCPGPWLMVDLDPGRYRVTLDLEEHSRTVDLQVTAQRQDVVVVHLPLVYGQPAARAGES